MKNRLLQVFRLVSDPAKNDLYNCIWGTLLQREIYSLLGFFLVVHKKTICILKYRLSASVTLKNWDY